MSSTPPLPVSKKRKLRKGATSCWECKRRKARCVFSSSNGSVCIGCQDRDIFCVSQADKDDAEARDRGEAKVSRLRLERIETMLEALSEETRENKNTKKASRSIPALEAEQEDLLESTLTLPQMDLATLSGTLHSLLPSQDQVQSLCTTGNFIPCFFQQLLTRNYSAISASNNVPLTGADIATLLPADAHPVLLAQKLLMYACLTQYHNSASRNRQWRTQASRMALAAIDLVTTKDALVANAEGPECLMMEATYHVNNGDLRRAFSAVRRAMSTAQLLGIHRPVHREYQRLDGTAPAFDPTYIWYRIVYTDRIFCLILGLPQGSTDVSFATSAGLLGANGLSAEEKLERTHCAIAARILERNECDAEDTLDMTQSIDASIQAATTTLGLPEQWWSIPSLSLMSTHRDRFLATNRLVSQVLHYNLVNQTHLPYHFKSDPINAQSAAFYENSRNASTTASREILHRYLLLQHSSLIAHAYHFVDFFALIAAITLLLLHLESHWPSTSTKRQPSILSHMRASDRATIQQAMRFMTKAPVCDAPKILTELLAVEDEAYALRSVGSGQISKHDLDNRPYFELRIPFFGCLRVSPEKVCFHKLLEIEQLSSSLKHLPLSDAQEDESDKDKDTALVQDWALNAFPIDVDGGTDVFGGVENAFLDSFQDYLESHAL